MQMLLNYKPTEEMSQNVKKDSNACLTNNIPTMGSWLIVFALYRETAAYLVR